MHEAAIRQYLACEIETLQRLDIHAIDAAARCFQAAFAGEHTIFVCGNGGSAATASHLQNDFNKGISEYTVPKFHVCCLNDNVATILAIANDIAFEEIFQFQLTGRLKEGDVLLAISGSGNSPNILRAAEYAKRQGNTVIGMTGYDGGKLSALSDISLHVPVRSMQVTEDVHLIFNHLLMSLFYKILCGKDHLM